MNRQDRNRKSPSGKLIGIILVLLLSEPGIFLPLLVIGGIGYGIYWLVKAKAARPQPQHSAAKFDDCPQPLFCFHKDKGEHHVVRGREIDPWDRPDIDISKYQRRE